MTSALIIGCVVVAAIAIIEIPSIFRSIKLLLVCANRTLRDIEGDLDDIRDELRDMRKDQLWKLSCDEETYEKRMAQPGNEVDR